MEVHKLHCSHCAIYEAEVSYESFYTGGAIEWTNDGEQFFCHCGTSIQSLDVNSGQSSLFVGEKAASSFDEDYEDVISTFIINENNDKVVTAHRNGLLKLWDFNGKLLKHWKSVHKGPIVRLSFNKAATILASGGSDSSVRLWDILYNTCLKLLTGVQGVCSVLKFFEDDANTRLFGAGDNMSIVCWEVPEGNILFTCTGHYSPISCIGFSPCNNYIISCGRDCVIITWNLKDGKQINAIPLYENPEDLVILPSGDCLSSVVSEISKKGIYFIIAGEKGKLRVFEALTCKEVWASPDRISEGAIMNLKYNSYTSSLATVSFDHNIYIHSLESLSKIKKQFVGFFDEVLDIIFVGNNETHFALATNSPAIKLFRREDMNCQILKGHEDFVLSLAVSVADSRIFASASKDHSFRVWALWQDAAECVAAGMCHNSSVTSLAFSVNHTFIVSGSEDTILKQWSLPKVFKSGKEPKTLVVKSTCIAHEKELNDIAVAPSNSMLATASSDKTVKLWSTDDLSLMGTLRGHRRGVWCVRFSPVDKVCLTSSADTTLKIWSLSDLTCLKTFEGHDSSVMKAAFLSRGLQIVSASGDGLLKLWRIGNSECIGSFDAHKGKIWALAVSHDESELMTGCSSSRIVLWRDVTEKKKQEEAKKQAEKVLADQELSNLLQREDLLPALKLALFLDRPATVLKIIRSTLKSTDNQEKLKAVLSNLEDSEKIMLLNCAAHWNTNSKSCYIAQLIISIFLMDIASNKLKVPETLIEALLPYTERHFQRVNSLLQDLQILEYTRKMMKL